MLTTIFPSVVNEVFILTVTYRSQQKLHPTAEPVSTAFVLWFGSGVQIECRELGAGPIGVIFSGRVAFIRPLANFWTYPRFRHLAGCRHGLRRVHHRSDFRVAAAAERICRSQPQRLAPIVAHPERFERSRPFYARHARRRRALSP